MLRLSLLLSLWCLSAVCHVDIYPDDPYSNELSSAEFVPPEETFTNLTIDQLISQSYGGSHPYMSDYFMDTDGSYLAEMDMRLNSEQFDAIYGDTFGSKRKKRKATRPLRFRWTNKVMPYEFAPGHFNSREVYTVKQALQEWSDATCMQFRPATSSDRNKVRFQNGAGCNSALGMVGGTQAINLQSPSCRYKGLYLHEVGHALGLVHEHQLPDRDAYITILYNNVSPGLRIWFNKYPTSEVNQYGVPYEYSSVMHYGVTAFSIDGRSKTIQTKDPSKESLIGRVYLKGLSFSDIKVVNLMYECNKHCAADPSCNDPGYLDKNCQCVCPQGVDCSTETGGGGGGRVRECTNTYPGGNCDTWAARGECDANPEWMRTNCQRSCNTCPTGPATTTTTTTTTTTVTQAPSTTTYMPSPPPSSTISTTTQSTPSTPRSTATPPGGTTVTGPSVATPSGGTTVTGPSTTTPSGGTTVTGSSTTTPSGGTTVTGPPVTTMPGSTTSPGPTTTYMPSTPPTSPTTSTANPCVNDWGDNDCNNWSRIGECTRNRIWMREHCTRACNACTGGGGGGGQNCQNRHHYCNYWARTGWCNRSTYMSRNCRRACNLCNS